MNEKTGIHVGIVLAGGTGKRMKTSVPKQYLDLEGYPVLYYSLKCFQDSFMDYIVVVCGSEYMDHVRENLVDKYRFDKVICVVSGGEERYNSVFNGLCATVHLLEEKNKLENNSSDCDFFVDENAINNLRFYKCNDISEETADSISYDMKKMYIYIHDGARPLITGDLLSDLKSCVLESGACVTGTAVKDTIKIADRDRKITATPNREELWCVQTPQVFRLDLIYGAYAEFIRELEHKKSVGTSSEDASPDTETAAAGHKKDVKITDDTQVLELYGDDLFRNNIRIIPGDPENIKLTTEYDLKIAGLLLRDRYLRDIKND